MDETHGEGIVNADNQDSDDVAKRKNTKKGEKKGERAYKARERNGRGETEMKEDKGEVMNRKLWH